MRAIQSYALISALIWTTFPPAQAATAQPIFRAGTKLVTVHVSVVDHESQPVAGLTADHFDVFEDGRRMPVQFFADGALPLDVGILLDTSGSMGSALPLIQQAGIRFVRALGAGDRATILGLSRPSILQSITADKSALERAILATVAAGETPLYATIYSALRLLTKGGRVSPGNIRRQALIVLSDGIDSGRGLDFRELLTIAHRHTVPIYVIAPRGPEWQRARIEAALQRPLRSVDFELRQLASDTGGRAFFPKTLHELGDRYDDIAQELGHQYTLGYYASDQARGGQFRQLTIRVDRTGVQWRARTGYVANP